MQKAQMWLLCECEEDVVMLFSPCAEKTMSAAHQALWYRLSVCWHPLPSLSPAGSSAHTFLMQGQCQPRAQRSKWLLGVAGGSSTLASCSRQAQSGREHLAFLHMLSGAQGLGCLVTQAAHCFPYKMCLVRYKCPSSLSHFAAEAA